MEFQSAACSTHGRCVGAFDPFCEKHSVRHLVGDRLLTDEELTSFLCEAEKILNDRPLTRMGSDAQDPTPLTPNHLLLLRGKLLYAEHRSEPCAPTLANYSTYCQQILRTISVRVFASTASTFEVDDSEGELENKRLGF